MQTSGYLTIRMNKLSEKKEAVPKVMSVALITFGTASFLYDPDVIRTHYLPLRRRPLYPDELQDQK